MDRIIGFDNQLIIQIFFQFFNTLVCVMILYHFLYKPVKKFMQNRTNRIAKEIKDTEKNSAQVQKLKSNYEQKLVQIENEKNEILEAAHKQAIINKDLIITEAKREAAKIIERANLEIKYEKQQIHADMKNQVVNISWIVISDFLQNNLDSEMQNKLADLALKKMGETKW